MVLLSAFSLFDVVGSYFISHPKKEKPPLTLPGKTDEFIQRILYYAFVFNLRQYCLIDVLVLFPPLSLLLDQGSDQACPTRLVAGAHTASVIPMEVLIK